MNYSDIKKLDEETGPKELTEGVDPCGECLCFILTPPEGEKKGFRQSIQSIKKAFASKGEGRQEKKSIRSLFSRHSEKNEFKSDRPGHSSVEIPLTYTKGRKGIYTTREALKPTSSCDNCDCKYENIVLKHSYAKVRITSPDISSICTCPSNCLPVSWQCESCLLARTQTENFCRCTIEL